MLKTGTLATLLSATMLSAAHADMLDITWGSTLNGITYTQTDVPITDPWNWGAGLGSYPNGYLYPQADGGFWVQNIGGTSWVRVDDKGITSHAGWVEIDYTVFDFVPGGFDSSAQLLLNYVPITSGQIVDLGSGPYTLSAIFTADSHGLVGGGYMWINSTTIPVDAPISSVPGPIVGGGISGLMALALLALARLRRRLRAA